MSQEKDLEAGEIILYKFIKLELKNKSMSYDESMTISKYTAMIAGAMIEFKNSTSLPESILQNAIVKELTKPFAYMVEEECATIFKFKDMIVKSMKDFEDKANIINALLEFQKSDKVINPYKR